MTVESPIKAEEGWFRGEDKTLTFYITTGRPIRVAATAIVGDLTITVDPLKEALSSGAKLRLGQQVVTLSAAAAVGATSISVSTLTGGLLKGSVLKQCQDITNYTIEWILKTSPTATTVTLTKTVSLASVTEGVCTVSILDTDTDALDPATYWYRLKRTDASFETVFAYGYAVLLGY